MQLRLAEFRRELRPMWGLAWPLAVAELGWMAQGLIDLIMAGPLGAAAIGAGSLANMLFYPIAICGTGVLLGMDTLVAQSHGAEDPRDCRKTLVNGVWVSLGLTPPLIAIMLGLIPLMRALGTNPHVLVQFEPYLRALIWSILPLLLYSAFRRYLQAVDIVKPVTFSLLSANVVNVVGNWVLMYGHWGAHAMGLEGSGWSTAIARLYMAAVLFVALIWHERATGRLLIQISWRPHWDRIRRLILLGVPAAGQIGIEGGLFAVVTVLVAKLDEASLAAHSITVNVVSTTFMVPLGISSAAAVRVGQAVGRKDLRGVALSGWTAVLFGALFMGSAGLALGFLPRWIVRVFSADPAVISSGAVLLQIAALFQLFDGFQVVSTGALRGLGDTRTPMLAHLAGYWVVGLPISYVLCFHFGWGARGIWTGLSIALILIGASLLLVWRGRVRSLLPIQEHAPPV
ncbi:MAG TPA: MATE family efflux transporter [Bryobacteraceae bacterium]|nr:MATE family efflux transporter [Bryobacteraceae bacterium]